AQASRLFAYQVSLIHRQTEQAQHQDQKPRTPRGPCCSGRALEGAERVLEAWEAVAKKRMINSSASSDLDKRVVLARIGSKHFAPAFYSFVKDPCPYLCVKVCGENLEHFVQLLRPLGYWQKAETARHTDSVVMVD